MDWQDAEDIKEDLADIIKHIDLPHINLERIYCYRTKGSKTRAYARTWAFPKIFQSALLVEPAYVIEVLSQHYDKLDEDKRKKYLFTNYSISQKFFRRFTPPQIKKQEYQFPCKSV